MGQNFTTPSKLAGPLGGMLSGMIPKHVLSIIVTELCNKSLSFLLKITKTFINYDGSLDLTCSLLFLLSHIFH